MNLNLKYNLPEINQIHLFVVNSLCKIIFQNFKQETVSKLLSSFFKEDKTKCELNNFVSVSPTFCLWPKQILIWVPVSGDASLLMAEMLKVFVQGKSYFVCKFLYAIKGHIF